MRFLMGLTLLEGSRRQESGDTAGAWECYRAVLRMTTHVRRRGSLTQRYDLNRGNRWLQQLQRLTTWAADPRTTIPQLDGALKEVLKNEPRTEWDSFALKYGYLAIMRSLEQPVHTFVQEDVGWEYTYRLDDMQLSEGMVGHLDAAHRFLLREPERSRRVLRLLCANWLAQVATVELRQRKPAVWASFPLRLSTNPITNGTTRVPLYPVARLAPTAARSLPPQELASWLLTTNDAKLRMLVADSNNSLPYSPLLSFAPLDYLRDRTAHRARHHAGHGDLSPRARRTTAYRGRLGRELSPGPARRRIGRVRRGDDADGRVADSDVSAHPSGDVARGRRPPPSDLEADSGASHRRVRPSPQRAYASTGGRNSSAVARAGCQRQGSLPSDSRRPVHDSSCLGVKDGFRRTVRLNRCRGRRRIIRTDSRVGASVDHTNVASLSCNPLLLNKLRLLAGGPSDKHADI